MSSEINLPKLAPLSQGGAYQSCYFCQKPLGADSKDGGFPVCPDHRNCLACNSEVSAKEIVYCLQHDLPVKHVRCLSVRDSVTLPQQIDIVNIQRLLSGLRENITSFSFDQQYQLLKEMQDIAAFISGHVRLQNSKLLQKQQQEKNEQKKEQATAEAKTSSRPTNKSATAIDETTLANFMGEYGIVERTVGLKELKAFSKQIETLQKYGLSEEIAKEQTAVLLRKRYPKAN